MRIPLPQPGTLAAGLLLTCSLGARAQQRPPAPAATQSARTVILKSSALQLLARGYHLEVEKALRPHQSLGLTAQLYRGTVLEITASSTRRDNEQVRGYGAELLHRVYLSPGLPPLTGFYLGYGPHFQRFDLAFRQNGWQEQLGEDGLLYYQYGPVDYTETIHRYGATAVAGFQDLLEGTRISLDLYVGVGYRRSDFRSKLAESHYRSGLLDYGHRGFYLPAGFKIGFML
ncbi:DUF3575 domain-containing protein [Hymenobacter sp. B81]|uniref:DUF3575 domain-containing protein n=1 Tax=Hymenobacter sp. B81 TaxID=3344878 RepID=UPI0037DC6294